MPKARLELARVAPHAFEARMSTISSLRLTSSNRYGGHYITEPSTSPAALLTSPQPLSRALVPRWERGF